MCSDDEDVSFLKELERENEALERELKAIQESYVAKAQKSYTNMDCQLSSDDRQKREERNVSHEILNEKLNNLKPKNSDRIPTAGLNSKQINLKKVAA